MRHTLTVKLIIYYLLIILVHVYCGFIIPQFQIMPMCHNYWLVAYYLSWGLYFYYSGLQIKEGYPFQAYKNYFKHDTQHVTFAVFKVYKAVPFMWELKVITDWTVTSTCLELT